MFCEEIAGYNGELCGEVAYHLGLKHARRVVRLHPNQKHPVLTAQVQGVALPLRCRASNDVPDTEIKDNL